MVHRNTFDTKTSHCREGLAGFNRFSGIIYFRDVLLSLVATRTEASSRFCPVRAFQHPARLRLVGAIRSIGPPLLGDASLDPGRRLGFSDSPGTRRKRSQTVSFAWLSNRTSTRTSKQWIELVTMSMENANVGFGATSIRGGVKSVCRMILFR